jgi:murein DD-endopeptidase MepM/ murein hydrolase activator NlpD
MAFAVFFGLRYHLVIADTSSATGGADQAAIDQLNKQLEEQKKKVDDIVDKITEYNSHIKETRGQAVTLQNQMAIIDNQMAKTDLDIESKQEEVKQTQLEIQVVSLQIKQSEEEIAKNKKELSSFIRLLSRYDNKNIVSVMLSYNSFSDFFDQVKYSEEIQSDLQKSLNRVQELVAKLNSQQDDLNKKKKQLDDLVQKLEDAKASLSGQKGEKDLLITETKKSERKFQSLVTDLKKEQAAANAQIAAIEKKLRAELAKKGKGEKLNTLSNAVLSWPTISHRITCLFRDPTYPYRNLFEHSGLDIGIGKGTPVMAAEAGYVGTVGINTKWYGNYVMIIHSNNLSTLYAHFTSVSVKKDSYVSKGQIIGYSGNTGFSSGPHLHFEVRSNGVPVDPLNYIP